MALASFGGLLGLYVGFGVLAGLLGVSCVGSPLLTYVSLWFEKRRGSAVALISSGQAVAGALFPPLLQWGSTQLGWRSTMLFFALFIFVSVTTLALVFLQPAPVHRRKGAAATGRRRPRDHARPAAQSLMAC